MVFIDFLYVPRSSTDLIVSHALTQAVGGGLEGRGPSFACQAVSTGVQVHSRLPARCPPVQGAQTLGWGGVVQRGAVTGGSSLTLTFSGPAASD